MKPKSKKYTPRTEIPKVGISVSVTSFKYEAMQRVCAEQGCSLNNLANRMFDGEPIRNLTKYENEAKEAYAASQNHGEPFDPTFTKISNDPQINNDKRR